MEHAPLIPLFFLLPVVALMGSLGRRVAGGGFTQWTNINLGDLPVRLFFGLMIAVSAFLAGLPLAHAATLIVAGWIGTTIPNFGGIGFGRSGNPWWKDALGLLAHGTIGMLVLALFMVLPMAGATLFAVFGQGITLATAIAAVAGGVAIVPAYWIGWSISGVSGKASFPLGLRGGSELGEVLWGAAVGVTVALAVVI